MKQSVKDYKRIVIKIGSSLIFPEDINSDFAIDGIIDQVADLVKFGKEVIIVSSGAVASGMHILKMKSRPRQVSSLQATAAVGQHLLMYEYRKFFEKKGLTCAQVLLTWEDFDDRKRYLNAKNTLLTLLKLGSIPIINENDTISTDEIKFGDNDRLSALVATLINADLLVILSDVDGLLDRENKVIKIVDEITPQIRALACPTDKKICVGGMITKLEAAKIAVGSGIPCVIANGKNKCIIRDITETCLTGGSGTFFLPKKSLAQRQRWIAFGTKSKGRIMVDDGAKKALMNKKSLLSVGVAGLEGNFECGDIVSVVDKHDSEFARGKAGLSSQKLDKIKGSRFDKEVIHRDNIVIL
ncbi:MAG: glutamate 5-kinase [Candidatus Omnitrophica bacterium]|nr:glutamate 5-kinase [Candidatus Omnitrophota bacterium]